MVICDVRDAALNLVMERDEPLDSKLVLVKRMIEAAVEIVNDPSKVDDEIDNLMDSYDGYYGITKPDEIILHYVDVMKKAIKAASWDTRLVVKVKFNEVGNGKALCHADLFMDLDTTAEKLGWVAAPEDEDSKEAITEIVSDNPSAEQLHALSRSVSREGKQRTPVLSDRSPRFVRENPERDKWIGMR